MIICRGGWSELVALDLLLLLLLFAFPSTQAFFCLLGSSIRTSTISTASSNNTSPSSGPILRTPARGGRRFMFSAMDSNLSSSSSGGDAVGPPEATTTPSSSSLSSASTLVSSMPERGGNGSGGGGNGSGSGGDGGDGGGVEAGIADDDNSALFVYGTLMNEKVLHALLGRVPPSETASLFGYHRYRIKDHVYPAIRPKEGSSVKGLFMPGLDAREKLIFDIFEDEDYDKVHVQVRLHAGNEGADTLKTATAYVWNASLENQLYSTWNPPTHFADDSEIGRKYVEMVEGFSEEIQREGLLREAEAAAGADGNT